jgi:hypothetical protein
MPRRSALITLIVVAVLASGTDAHAAFRSHKIAPFRSVGGLHFGEKLLDIVHAVGPPAAPPGPYYQGDDSKHGWVESMFMPGVKSYTGPLDLTHSPTVDAIAASEAFMYDVTAPEFRDPHGIHVGSTLAQVKKAYPNLRIPRGHASAYACRGALQMTFLYAGRRGNIKAKVGDIELSNSLERWRRAAGGRTKHHC